MDNFVLSRLCQKSHIDDVKWAPRSRSYQSKSTGTEASFERAKPMKEGLSRESVQLEGPDGGEPEKLNESDPGSIP